MTLGLFIWSLLLRDAVAALSIACMSLASTSTGFAFKWHPQLAKRPSDVACPPGDLILKMRNGAFVVVHCDEPIARELYTAADEVNYQVGTQIAKVLVGFGTLNLMVAVVLLGNCSWAMQAAIGGAYLILNGAYWLVALLPPTWSWHLTAYEVVKNGKKKGKKNGEMLPDDDHPKRPAHMFTAHVKSDALPPSYTRTLWYAIHCSKDPDGNKSGEWLKNSGALPQTEAWQEWEKEALIHINDPEWDAVREKDKLHSTRHAKA